MPFHTHACQYACRQLWILKRFGRYQAWHTLIASVCINGEAALNAESAALMHVPGLGLQVFASPCVTVIVHAAGHP